MPILQITRTTSGMSIAGGIQGFYSQLSALLQAMQPGNPVRASDINALKNLIAAWDAHTHTVTDLVGKDTFGNLTTYTVDGTTVTVTSAPVKGATAPNLTVAPGQAISYTNHNVLQEAIEYFRSGHTHSITDTTS